MERAVIMEGCKHNLIPLGALAVLQNVETHVTQGIWWIVLPGQKVVRLINAGVLIIPSMSDPTRP